MKKLLLFVCAAFATMSVGAQGLAKAMDNSKSLLLSKTPYKANIKGDIKEAIGSIKDFSAIKSNKAKAPTQSDLYGSYVEDTDNGEFHECASAEVSAITETVEGITTENVKMTVCNGYAEVYGTYDAEAGTITVQPQYCYTNETYGQCIFMGIIEKADGLYYTEDPVTFTVSDDGLIYCDFAGYCARIAEGDYQGQLWSACIGTITLMKPNAIQAGHHNGRNTTGWEEYAYNVFAEDYDFQVNVYNFCGQGLISIDVNEDGTVSIATGQPIAGLGLSDEAEIAVYGNTLNLTGVTIEGQSIYIDFNKETISGTIAGNTITIGEYMKLASKPDADGAAYGANWYADGTTITLNEGEFLGAATGIEEVTTTLEERAKNSKTYNIMGQRVNRATAKGLLIRDGKKFIKKN